MKDTSTKNFHTKNVHSICVSKITGGGAINSLCIKRHPVDVMSFLIVQLFLREMALTPVILDTNFMLRHLYDMTLTVYVYVHYGGSSFQHSNQCV